MTPAQLEERVLALEQTVARLEEKVERSATGNTPNGSSEDEIIDGVEFDFVPNVPPKEIIKLRARIVAIERAPVGLSLSDEEWESIAALLEDDAHAR